MRKRNIEYETHLYKKKAREELAFEQNLPEDSIPEEEVEARAIDMKNSFDETVSDETYDAATAWLQGFEKMAGSLEAGLPSGVRETMIFSLLGSSLLLNLREMLNVNTDNLTVENQRDAAAMVQEFAKIFMWIGGNVQELYKEVPGVD